MDAYMRHMLVTMYSDMCPRRLCELDMHLPLAEFLEPHLDPIWYKLREAAHTHLLESKTHPLSGLLVVLDGLMQLVRDHCAWKLEPGEIADDPHHGMIPIYHLNKYCSRSPANKKSLYCKVCACISRIC